MLQRIRDAKKNQSGFTLIELLIVIVILGILAAVVVFAVSAFNNNGKAAACKSDFKSVEIADEAYFAKSNPQAYATTMGTIAAPGQLVPTYLKEPPSTTNGYVITLTAAGPVISVNGGAATADATTACSALS
jgi:prepilin-type N-terminal cleavage/methylation domain-containing protein